MNVYSVTFRNSDETVTLTAMTAVTAPNLSDAALKAIAEFPTYGELIKVERIA